MLYGDWAAACDIYHRFHALLITRLISPVCAKHTLFVCGVAHTVHRHLSMCSTSGVSICGVSICASRYTGCTAQREVSMHDVSILYGASYMECAARNRRGRRQPMPRRAGYAPSAPPCLYAATSALQCSALYLLLRNLPTPMAVSPLTGW